MTTHPFGFDYGDDVLTHFLDGKGAFRALASGDIPALPYLPMTAINSTGHYTGFPDRTSTAISWDDTTYTLTLTATADPIWINGVPYTINTLTQTLSVAQEAATGLYWFWVTAPLGVPQLNADTSPPGFDKCLVATVYWNTTTSKGLLGEERHWMGRDQWMHEYLHETLGARYAGGLTGTFGNTTFAVTAGEIYDEDIELHMSGDTPMAYPGADITTCQVLYHNGDADWAWDENSTTPYKITTGNLRFNTGNTLSTAGANRFVNYFVYGSNHSTTSPLYVFVGTGEYTTAAAAAAAPIPSLGNLPAAEMKLLYKITYKNDGTPTYQSAVDYRGTSNLPTANFVPTSHGSLSGLAVDDHAQYWLSGAVGRTTNFLTSGTLGAGAITGTTFNKLTLTAPATGSTLTIADGKTLTANNTLTLAGGSDGLTLTVPATGTALVKSGALTAGYIPFGVASSLVGEDSGLFWDNVNKRLGAGTVTPLAPIEAKADVNDIFSVHRSTDNWAGIRFDGVNTGVVGRIKQKYGSPGGAGNTFDFTLATGASEYIALRLSANSSDLKPYAYFPGKVSVGFASPLAKIAVDGGLHVGGESDPGDNNLLVDGTLTVSGASITTPAESWIGPSSTDGVYFKGGNIGIGKTTSIDHNLDVAGGINTDDHYHVDDVQVVGNQGAAVADATDAASVILRLNELLARVRVHGLIAT